MLRKNKYMNSNYVYSDGDNDNFATKATNAIPVIGDVLSIIPKDIYDKTFGALFSNGFNVKCWGATWNPTKAERVFLEESEIVKARLSQVLSTPMSSYESAVNNFWVWFYSVQAPARDWLNTSAKDCTKDGLKILIGALDGLAAQCRNSISLNATSKGYNIKQSGTVTKTYQPDSAGRHALTYQVPQYSVTASATGSLLRGGFNIQKAGFGIVGGILIVGLIVGTMYYGKKGKGLKK